MNIKGRRKKTTSRNDEKRGDRIRYLQSLRDTDRKHKTFKACLKV